MNNISSAPDLSALEIPIDTWTAPFWTAASEGRLQLPRCAVCHRFRWPPGPFCPHCQSQHTEWCEPGVARIYSFTIVHVMGEDGETRVQVPALIEFPDADGVRLLAAIVDTAGSELRVGAALKLGWSQAANAKAPVFSVV